MTEELQRVLKELHSITNKFALTGEGVAGDLLHGYTVDVQNPGGAFGGGPTPPPITGACCVGSDCSITTESECSDLGGIYQGDNTPCDPNPCPQCAGATHLAASFTFDADDGTFFFSGSATVECDLNASCECTNTEIVSVTVHNHLGDNCSPDPNVSCSVHIVYAGGGIWNIDGDVLMTDHQTVCEGSGWPPDGISAFFNTSFSGAVFSGDLTPTTAIILNAHVDAILT